MSNEGSLRRRGLIAAAIGFCVFAVVLASAATLTVNSGDLGAGTDLVASCDTDGVTTSIATTYTSGTGYTVTSVTVRRDRERVRRDGDLGDAHGRV